MAIHILNTIVLLLLSSNSYCKLLASDLNTASKSYPNYVDSDNPADSDVMYHSTIDRDVVYHNSLTALDSPGQCHLLLVCAILQSGSVQLTNSSFMDGLLALAEYQGDHPLVPALAAAVNTGISGRPCNTVAPDCQHSDTHLLTDMLDLLDRDTTDTSLAELKDIDNGLQDNSGYQHRERRQVWRQQEDRRRVPGYAYSPHRRQGLLSGIPPVFRPENAGRLAVCQGCDRRGTVCTVYGIGTFIGCNGIALAAGPGGPAVCNAATTPGSIGCGINTLYCYSSGCGLISLPRLPGR